MPTTLSTTADRRRRRTGRGTAAAPLGAAIILMAAGAILAMPGGIVAQSELTVEVGASQIGPALNVTSDDARFGMLGLRGSHYTAGGSGIFGTVLAGTTLGGSGGERFVSGILEGRLADRWSTRLEASLEARLLGFDARTPYSYQAVAVEGGPSLRWIGTDFSLELAGVAGLGRSEIELWRVTDGPTRAFENDLRRAGGTAALMLGPVTSRFGLTAGWHDTPQGEYRSVGARTVFAGTWGIAELRADRWTTPLETEVVAGVTVALPLGSAWSLRGFLGRTDPDPLTLAQPGTASGGVLLGRDLLAPSGEGAGRLYEVVGQEGRISRVRFVVRAPRDASTVQLLGDFSLWEPVGMRAEGDDVWSVEVEVEEGVHHFGFLVDGEWYLPDDAPDVVPDEWGRESATLVIEGALR